MRQLFVRENDPPRGVSISTFARDYPVGAGVALHAHFSDQLVYASRGVMEISSGQHVWILPPYFGLWIPARVLHRIRMLGNVSMRTLYLRPGLAAAHPSCVVLHVRPFFRELIFETVRIGALRAGNPLERALRDLLIAQLAEASPVPTGVVLPRDTRVLAVARKVIENPQARQSLATMCAAAGVGVRTLQRTFQRDIGMDFESWRRQVRLMKAVELLVAGASVKQIAFEVGYQEPSAFVRLFRETFGATPKAWISNLRK